MTRRRTTAPTVPLLEWGDALRARRIRRQKRRKNAGLVAFGIAMVGLTIALPPAPRLVWNATASAPIGLYWVRPGVPIDAGDMVIAWAPKRFRALAARRHYLPFQVPLVKRVVGVGGDDICARGAEIFLDGNPVAMRRKIDARGRPMPWWKGCIHLHGRQIFLLMEHSPSSFDGRYFGATMPADVIGKARRILP